MEKSCICIVELPRVRRGAPIKNECQRWQRFFVESKDLEAQSAAKIEALCRKLEKGGSDPGTP